MGNKFLYGALLTLFSAFSYGQNISTQEFKAEMNKTRKCYVQDNITLTYSRELIVPESSVEPVESVKGIIHVGEKGKFRLEENGTLVIQNGSYKMTVDSLEKTVLVESFDKDFRPINISEIDQDSVLKDFTIAKKITEDKIEFNLQHKLQKEVSMLLTINKKTYEIITLVYHLPAGNYVSETLDDESLEKPVLVLNYFPIKKLNEKQDIFSTKSWIPLETLPLKINDKLSDYLLYDSRISSYN